MTEGNERDQILPELRDARERFDELVRAVIPDLHRFCARMTGSVIDGQDVVQDALAQAYFSLGELQSLASLRAWLFRIAHRRAIDFHRRYERRMSRSWEELPEESIAEAEGDPAALLEAAESVRTSFALFVQLPPSQRSAVILKDVLGHSTEEIAELLGSTVPAVQACLHRGRARLRALAPMGDRARAPIPAVVGRYAHLFGAGDWQGVRELLAEEVRLDLVGHHQRVGRSEVGRYYTNYATLRGWRVEPGWLEGRVVIAFFADARDQDPTYVIEVSAADDQITTIRDFRFVPHLLNEATVELQGGP